MASVSRGNYKMSLEYILQPLIPHEKHTTTSLSTPGATPTHTLDTTASLSTPRVTSTHTMSRERKIPPVLFNSHRKPKPRLRDVYGKIGKGIWAVIAGQMPGRTGEPLHQRRPMENRRGQNHHLPEKENRQPMGTNRRISQRENCQRQQRIAFMLL